MKLLVFTAVALMIGGTVLYSLLVSYLDAVRHSQATTRLNCLRSPVEDADF